MAKNRNAGIDQSFNLRGQNGPTFNFHSLDPRLLHQTARGLQQDTKLIMRQGERDIGDQKRLGIFFVQPFSAAWCKIMSKVTGTVVSKPSPSGANGNR